MDNTSKAIEVFDEFAVSYQDKFMHLDTFHDSYDIFCNCMGDETASVLDLACGPGNISHYLLSKHPRYRLTGIDLSPNMIRLAALNNPSGKFLVMDCRKFAELEQVFDGIIAGFYLPYLTIEETEQFIETAYRQLGPKGVLYISTMEDKHEKSGFKKGSSGKEIYMQYHEAMHLQQTLERCGFTVTEIQRKPYPEKDGSITTDLVIIACKALK